MDRSRPAYLHDNGLGSHLRRYLCRTYAVPTTVPMPYLSPGSFRCCLFSNNESTTQRVRTRSEERGKPLSELGLETLRESLGGGYPR
jgi:hypothetical protein